MRKVLSFTAIVVGGLLLISTLVPMLIGLLITASAEPTAVGIIGGADGPTAIMITASTGLGGMILAGIAGILLIAAGIWQLVRIRKTD